MTGNPLDAFEAHRARLHGLAYRMLGSRAEAEDVVQETYLRWHERGQAAVENPQAWLVTTATRLALDRLRRVASERERYAGAWLPEPMVENAPPPDGQLDLSADLSIAFLTLLERLAPEERAAFLLHEVFDVGYPAIASVLGRSEAACRQAVHRSRERVHGDRRRFEARESSRASPGRRSSMRRAVAVLLAGVAAVALLAVLVHGVLVVAHVSEPAAVTVHGVTARRSWATAVVALALIGVGSGAVALARLRGPSGSAAGLRGALIALGAGLVALVNGALNVALATGGPGTGNGVVGGAAAVVLGLAAMVLGAVALAGRPRGVTVS